MSGTVLDILPPLCYGSARIEKEEIMADKITITWSLEDILDRAEEIGVELTEEQASDVLDSLLRRHDCNIGINWDVIDV